jgi:hypothetical protein
MKLSIHSHTCTTAAAFFARAHDDRPPRPPKGPCTRSSFKICPARTGVTANQLRELYGDHVPVLGYGVDVQFNANARLAARGGAERAGGSGQALVYHYPAQTIQMETWRQEDIGNLKIRRRNMCKVDVHPVRSSGRHFVVDM